MKAKYLLRLYPPTWRERYGEEFLEMAGEADLSLQQIIDITSGAIDAWLSYDVRMATRPAGGGRMTLKAMACRGPEPHYTTRDSLIAAAVMIALTTAFALSGIVVKREGWTIASKMLLNMSFIVPFTISMPFWLMKGHSLKAKAVLIGTTVAFLIVLSFLAAI